MSLELKELSYFDSWETSQLHVSEWHPIYYYLGVEASPMARVINTFFFFNSVLDLFMLFEFVEQSHPTALKYLLVLGRPYARYWRHKGESSRQFFYPYGGISGQYRQKRATWAVSHTDFRLLKVPPLSGTWVSLPPVSHCSWWSWGPGMLQVFFACSPVVQAMGPGSVVTFKRRLSSGNWRVVPRFSNSQKFKCRECCRMSFLKSPR